MPNINDLPIETLQLVFAALDDGRSYLRAGHVCKRWREAAAAGSLQKQYYGYIPAKERNEECNWPLSALIRDPLIGLDVQTAGWLEFGPTKHNSYYMLSEPTLSPDASLLAVVYVQLPVEPDTETVSLELAVYSIDTTFGLCGRASLASLVDPSAMDRILTAFGISTSSSHPPANTAADHKVPDHVVVVNFSPDNGSIAMAVPGGPVHVLRVTTLRRPSSPLELGALEIDCTRPIYKSVMPSVVKQLFLSRDAEVLFVRTTRLGGITLVNLENGAEMDVGHYVLNMSVGVDWPAVCLVAGTNQNDTYMFGCAVSDDQKKYPRGALWHYLKEAVPTARSEAIPMSMPRRLQYPWLCIGSTDKFHMLPDGWRHVCIAFARKLEPDRMPSMDEFLAAKDPQQPQQDLELFQRYHADTLGDRSDTSDSENDDDDGEFEDDDDGAMWNVEPLGVVQHDGLWDVTPCRTRLAYVNTLGGRLALTLRSLSPDVLPTYDLKRNYRARLSPDIPTNVTELRFPSRDRIILLYPDAVAVLRLFSTTDWRLTHYSKARVLPTIGPKDADARFAVPWNRLCPHRLGYVCTRCSMEHYSD